MHDAIVSNKQAAADRYGLSWRAVNNMCVRVVTEALGRVDLLDGLIAVAIDEVKVKEGQRYLTVVCDHFTGRVVWAAPGRSKETVGEFFDLLGEDRCAQITHVAAWVYCAPFSRTPGRYPLMYPGSCVVLSNGGVSSIRSCASLRTSC